MTPCFIAASSQRRDQTPKRRGPLFSASCRANLLTFAAGFGHFNHDYVLTSHEGPGKTVDEVIVVQTSRSAGATSAEQLYVSVTRARDRLRVYTDDKAALRELALRGTEPVAAVDVFDTTKVHEQQVFHERSREQERVREQQRERNRGGYSHGC